MTVGLPSHADPREPGTVLKRAGQTLLVGAGQADITPVTGGFKGGWACSCAKALGQHTRLYARVIVLQQGGRKVALVAEDLAFLSAGMIRDAAALLPGRGFSEQNIIDSATHTHGSQTGFMNFGAYNSVLPEITNLTEFNLTETAADPAMYSFMTRQLAKAIRQADSSLAPGAIGWGRTTLSGLTENRSLEAHLAAYGIDEPPGTGSVDQDPQGYAGTIDPAVDVLRVDRVVKGKRRPIAVFTTFANHGTVVKENFPYYTADHQGAAERVLADSIRRTSHLKPTAKVVTAFANSDAGDMSSGLTYSGPADAELVGRREAAAMLRAWRQAGHHMMRHPVMDLRWTRLCMCGQSVDGHPTDTTPILGLAQAAGSEEGRTIFNQLGLAHEGVSRLPLGLGAQGRKIALLPEKGEMPQDVPLTALRLGDRMLVTWPGEATVGVGKLVRNSVLATTAASGIKQVVFTGYAGEYLDYWTTPQEYEAQHYEGGSTVYGQYASLLVRDAIVDLAGRLVRGQAAPAPHPFDPNNGTHVSAADYGAGAGQGVVTGQPTDATRLGHPSFSWTGGANGIDRPVGRAFVRVQRQTPRGWVTISDDLGLQMLWGVDAAGQYQARWEVPLDEKPGAHRFLITAKRYTLASAPFQVGRGAVLLPVVTSGNAVQLIYPPSQVNVDWTYRPAMAPTGRITFLVDGRTVRVKGANGRFRIPAGAHVSIPAGAARDASGNRNPEEHVIR
ncbi:neutral/alkaline non-lysosomal ceramidase N-terminal domain-containing protein [Nocardioides humilatus]|uniref:neutral/alkaline non-lysosomal ceramidase N-terminal domain-containing protein n=1 Tax=Nocardioides humilatus TaxID=2607660 RepID=UPI00165FBC39|nr:neutral/alkaline non-lysosomal ceramidase N-terminal domain-containing protein [Nocardioides humilatus]